jgi:hypothetical protein
MDEVELYCVDCGNFWTILCPVVIRDGEEIIEVDMFEDICPLCDSQGQIEEASGQAG